ncbi:DNA-binding protein [Streptomyces griseoloalbus]|uniref:helix-turn-helix domain-containing protein n=1 Tax=Streptomyces griseoloalbus TaxID=67303 RepID=UPI001875C440|nr:DNA-binding protein [Streptomyces griseoloalbus]
MAEKKTSPVPRPIQGVRRSTTPSGVTHVRTYQSGQYVVIGHHLAQHRELSLTAIGLAAHILSVPEGAPVDIRSLAERFPEGRDRIAFALRELEAHGYLERVREHTEAGRLVTRTYAHHTPSSVRLTGRPVPVGPVEVHAGAHEAAVAAEAGEPPQEDDQAGHQPPTPDQPEPVAQPRDDAPRDELHEKAVTLLAGLRRTDPRLTLSLRDVNRMAPGVVDWLKRGATPAAVHHTLTADLPVLMKHPAGVIAYRLRELLPPHLPPAPVPVADTGIVPHGRHPFQDCDGCDRVFRAPSPGRCRDCRPAAPAVNGTPCAA